MSQVLLYDCPQCGRALAQGALFCGNCGYALPKEEDSSPNTVTAKLLPTPTAFLPLTEAIAEGKTRQPTKPQDNLFDLRYPRPLIIRLLRALALLLATPFLLFLDWLINIGSWVSLLIPLFLLYLIGAIFSFFSLGINQTNIVPALLFIINNHWWQGLLFLLALAGAIGILISISLFTINDEQHEKAEISERDHPPGFLLRSVIHPNQGNRDRIAWSPNGQMLVLIGYSRLLFWKVEAGELVSTIDTIGSIVDAAWAPDSKSIAVIQNDGQLIFYDVQDKRKRVSFHVEAASSGHKIAWSSDGKTLAITSNKKNVVLLNSEAMNKTEQIVELEGSLKISHPAIAWMPGESKLAVCTDDAVQVWDTETKRVIHQLPDWKGASRHIFLAWSASGSILAMSDGSIVRLWNPSTGQSIGVLEGILDIVSLSFSCDERFLAAKGQYRTGNNGNVQVWRTDTWELVATLNEASQSFVNNTGIAFHPTTPNVLATRGLNNTIIRIWELDLTILLADRAPLSPVTEAKQPIRVGNPTLRQLERIADHSPLPVYFYPRELAALPPTANTVMVRYTNAKVVLLGDSGVGKSGLGLVLSQQPFVPTESTHGRHVWTFASNEVELPNGRKETRETLLWDLAGQPGYRLIHQLHLNEVTVALVVIDARSETDPFAGVYHWERALRVAQQARGTSTQAMQKFLIAARIDRSGIGVSHTRVEGLLRDLGFAGYFETSAKDGRGIQELKRAIEDAIDWPNLPWVISSRLFQEIKDFLVSEKEAGRVLSTVDDLYRSFLRANPTPADIEDLRAQFETCIGRVESRGLIRQLSFGNLVLLQPELLDTYASALINEVRDEPDGLGSISEARVATAQFVIPTEQRLKDREQEKVLLIAMVEDLLRYELALREQADDGQYLVFPSQSTRENPDLPDPEGKAVIFSFEGPIQNIYATLAVRLSHSGFFQKKELWKNAIAYSTQRGGTCGIFLQHTGEGQGRLTLFFGQEVSSERRSDFELYVETHLRRKALPTSIKRRRVLACGYCHTLVTDETIQKRAAQGLDWLNCPVCDRRVSLLEQETKSGTTSSSVVQKMDQQADMQRDLQTAVSIVQGKKKMQDFDVFLCHHGADKPAVKRIGEQLKQHGLLPWLDEWELRPGLPWQRLLEEQIEQIKSAAVFVGPAGIGPWQHQELDAFLREFVNRGVPVIPVLLPDAPREPRLPIFLSGMTWVDFRRQDPDPMQRLLWGITGKYIERPPK